MPEHEGAQKQERAAQEELAAYLAKVDRETKGRIQAPPRKGNEDMWWNYHNNPWWVYASELGD